MKTLREEIEKIVEAVYRHGHLTPNESYGLKKGQLTINESVNQLVALVERKMKKMSIRFAIATLENTPTGMFDSTPYKEKQIESLKKELK